MVITYEWYDVKLGYVRCSIGKNKVIPHILLYRVWFDSWQTKELRYTG